MARAGAAARPRRGRGRPRPARRTRWPRPARARRRRRAPAEALERPRGESASSPTSSSRSSGEHERGRRGSARYAWPTRTTRAPARASSAAHAIASGVLPEPPRVAPPTATTAHAEAGATRRPDDASRSSERPEALSTRLPVPCRPLPARGEHSSPARRPASACTLVAQSMLTLDPVRLARRQIANRPRALACASRISSRTRPTRMSALAAGAPSRLGAALLRGPRAPSGARARGRPARGGSSATRTSRTSARTARGSLSVDRDAQAHRRRASSST